MRLRNLRGSIADAVRRVGSFDFDGAAAVLRDCMSLDLFYELGRVPFTYESCNEPKRMWEQPVSCILTPIRQQCTHFVFHSVITFFRPLARPSLRLPWRWSAMTTRSRWRRRALRLHFSHYE